MSQGEPSKQLELDYTDAKIHASNLCRVANTPEEFLIDFGIQALGRTAVEIQTSVTMSPYSAKRLHSLLGLVLERYEQIYGPLETDSKKRMTPIGKAMQVDTALGSKHSKHSLDSISEATEPEATDLSPDSVVRGHD